MSLSALSPEDVTQNPLLKLGLLCKNLPLEILKELKNQSETIYKNSQKNKPIYFIQGKKF